MKAALIDKDGRPKLSRDQVVDLLARKKLPVSPAAIMKLSNRTKEEARGDIRKYEQRYLNTNVTPYVPAEVTADAEPSKATEPIDQIVETPKEKPGIQWSAIARSCREKTMALGIATLAGGLAYLQMGINFDFWQSIGQNSGASNKFGFIGIIIDLLNLILMPARQLLLDGGKKETSPQVWLTSIALFFCLASSTYASVSFASLNVDTAETRRQAVIQQIAKLEKERDQIARSQLDNVQRNKLRAADWATAQIKQYDEQIKELRKQSLISVPDLINNATRLLYAALPALCSLLFMVAFTIAFRSRQ